MFLMNGSCDYHLNIFCSLSVTQRARKGVTVLIRVKTNNHQGLELLAHNGNKGSMSGTEVTGVSLLHSAVTFNEQGKQPHPLSWG